MAPKPVKAPVTSVTKAATFRRVSPAIKSSFTAVQSNRARMRATNAAVRKALQGRQVQLGKHGGPTHTAFFGMYAAQRSSQANYFLQRTKLTAMKRSSTSSLGLAAGNWARKQAVYRAMRQQMTTMNAYGSQKEMQREVQQAATGNLPLQAVVRVTTRTRNTSAAARIAQSRRATAANQLRKGTKYKKGGGSSGSGKTSAPSIASVRQSRSNTRTRTSAPTAPVKTPTAARLQKEHVSCWITAGNDQGAENCAAVAIANHLWYHHGLRMTDDQVNDLARFKTIDGMLRYLRRNEIFENVYPEGRITCFAGPGDIAVYIVGRDTHAALLTEDLKVVAWGEEVPLSSPILEAWHIRWRTCKRSGKR